MLKAKARALVYQECYPLHLYLHHLFVTQSPTKELAPVACHDGWADLFFLPHMEVVPMKELVMAPYISYLWYILGFLSILALKLIGKNYPWRLLIWIFMIVAVIGAHEAGLTRTPINVATELVPALGANPYMSRILSFLMPSEDFLILRTVPMQVGMIPFLMANLLAFYICITGRGNSHWKFFAWMLVLCHFERIVPIMVILPSPLSYMFVSDKFWMFYVFSTCIMCGCFVDAIFKRKI